MRERPAFFAAASMRPASRPSKPAHPASTSIDSPDGSAKRVAWPPSTSMKWMPSGLSTCAGSAADSRRHASASGGRILRMVRQYNRRTMKRRDFVRLAGLGLAAGASSAESAVAQAPRAAARRDAPRKALMRVGTQHGDSDEILRYMAAFGVNHVCSRLPSERMDEKWSVDALSRLRERVESFGVTLDLVPLPLSSNEIEKFEMPNIMLGKSPERDREIDDICQMIRNASKAGIPTLKYNMSILGVVRTEPTPGRGNCSYSTFDYSKATNKDEPTPAGKVSDEHAGERVTYFLDRVVPVATEYKVRLAFHPQDPAMPIDRGYRGIHTVLGTVDGLKRFITIAPSPYH